MVWCALYAMPAISEAVNPMLIGLEQRTRKPGDRRTRLKHWSRELLEILSLKV